jgi:probable HAF family extracellular repeat protein
MPVQIFTTLDAPSATLSGTSANGINAAGNIVGHYQLSATVTNGFLYSGGTYTILANPLASNTEAFGINASGQIVGSFTDDNGDHGFVSSGGFSVILDDPVAIPGSTQAAAINDAGQVVGRYQDSRGGIHGFLYNPSGGGTYTTLDDPLATAVNRVTVPEGINNAGQVVGWYTDKDNAFHAFLFSGGTFTTIDVPGAIPGTTFAYGINNLGQIVGTYAANGASHGFLYSGGLYTNIDDPAAISFTNPRGINDAGQIVGFYADPSAQTGLTSHGFLETTVANPAAPAGTTADMVLRIADTAPTAGQYEIYDIGNSSILAGYSLGQVGTD